LCAGLFHAAVSCRGGMSVSIRGASVRRLPQRTPSPAPVDRSGRKLPAPARRKYVDCPHGLSA
ncbi:hypothetical protein RNT97_12565, partial [Staphylococcus pseudintermedius]